MDQHPKTNDWLLLILLAFIWGSSFILMKEGLKAFDATQVATLRIVITGLVMLPFALRLRTTVTRAETKTILIQGFFGNFFPAFLFAAAQTRIDSSVAGILNSLSTVWVLVIGLLFFQAPFKLIRVLGIACALGGALLLILYQGSIADASYSAFSLLIVVATISYGISANVIKRHLHEVPPMTIVAISFSLVLIPFLVYLFTTDFVDTLQTVPGAFGSLAFIALLALMGSAVASVLFNRLVHRTSSLFAASVSYLIPVVAVFWGLLDGEIIHAADVAGMGLIVAGVYLTSR
jgi:drug/metabolite transporter (DMT)-like permease